jgi:S1-C subfamily serine protease
VSRRRPFQISRLIVALIVIVVLIPKISQGMDGPLVTKGVLDKVDPQHQMSEGERNMAALSAVWRFYLSRGELEKAQRAARALIRLYRLEAAHYSAIVAAATKGGNIDTAAEAAMKAYANMPSGRDLKFTKADGHWMAQITDNTTGKVLQRKILTPQELGAHFIGGVRPEDYERVIAEAAGEDAEQFQPEQPRTSRPPSDVGGVTTIGSGFLITTEGHALTNAHVVNRCREITVRNFEDQRSAAAVVATNPRDDIAILKTQLPIKKVASLRASPSPRTGEAIVVYGFPLSGLLTSVGNATTGNISALAGIRNDARQLQISAPVQPGNSGGPLLDMEANVIGIVVSKLDALHVANLTEDIPQNVNFAIKASIAKNFLDSQGAKYTEAEAKGKILGTPDVVETAKAISIEIRCER